MMNSDVIINQSTQQAEETCQLLGDLGIIIQTLLGILCFLSLIYKRQKENPKRTWIIWFYDTSKQGFGSIYIHFANVFVSEYISSTRKGQDQCKWYFVNFTFDIIFGTVLNYLFIVGIEWSFNKVKILKFRSGQYGDESTKPLIKYFRWMYQLTIWMTILTINKILVLLLIISTQNVLSYAGEVVLYIFYEASVDLELVFVMIIWPIILNTAQFWVQDNFLKKQFPDNSQIHIEIPKQDTGLYQNLLDDIETQKKVKNIAENNKKGINSADSSHSTDAKLSHKNQVQCQIDNQL